MWYEQALLKEEEMDEKIKKMKNKHLDRINKLKNFTPNCYKTTEEKLTNVNKDEESIIHPISKTLNLIEKSKGSFIRDQHGTEGNFDMHPYSGLDISSKKQSPLPFG